MFKHTRTYVTWGCLHLFQVSGLSKSLSNFPVAATNKGNRQSKLYLGQFTSIQVRTLVFCFCLYERPLSIW